MTHPPLALQLYFPTGNPQGVRMLEQATSVIKMVEVPRADLKDFLAMPESKLQGVYILFGGERRGHGHCYIGQSSNLGNRLLTHNTGKDFWSIAWVIVFNAAFSQQHLLGVESELIRLTKEAGRYALTNGNDGQRPAISVGLRAEIGYILHMGRMYLDVLRVPIFEPTPSLLASVNNTINIAPAVYWCNAMRQRASGHYLQHRAFRVLKGSTAVRQVAMFVRETPIEKLRAQLYTAQILRLDGPTLVFAQDHDFRSIQEATAVILGRHSNVATEWFDREGNPIESHTPDIR
jgi:hypothetical protein